MPGTKLCLQRLEVVDCEKRVECEYYGWGSGRPKDAREPACEHASPELRRAVARRGYELFDGLPLQTEEDEIRALDVYASVGINSRVVLYDAVRFVRHAEQASLLLARIPAHARLEEGTDDQIRAAAELVRLFEREAQIGRSKATKVLYKKRHELIPVIDSVVGDFIWKNFPHVLMEWSSAKDVFDLFRQLLLYLTEPLDQVRRRLAVKGFDLSAARLLSFLIGLGWQKHSGTPIPQVWGVRTIPEARRKAREERENKQSACSAP